MLSRLLMAPVGLVYVAVVVLDRSPRARRISGGLALLALVVAGVLALR